MKRSVLVALALALLLAACGGDGDDDTSAVDTTAVTASTTGDSSGDGSAPPEAGPPTEIPDPCTLLTEDEAFTLLTTQTRGQYAAEFGSSDLPPMSGEDETGRPACFWGNSSVTLAVDIIPVGADLLEAYYQDQLNYWSGDPLPGVGDGAEIGGATPVGLDAFDGFWIINLQAYVRDEGSEGRFATAANLVFDRLAQG